jgi:hypothetical protein
MLRKSLVLLFSLISLTKLLSCQCGNYLLDLPIQEMGLTLTKTSRLASISDLIFNGTLLNTTKVTEKDAVGSEYESSKLVLTFKVIRMYKGEMTDTINIRTNNGSDACGFGAKLNTDCLIFARKSEKGLFYTYRSDCCKSISKEFEPKRYAKYIKFLHAVIDKIDGDYTFYQSNSYWKGGYPNKDDTLRVIQFSIKNKKFNGDWIIFDRQERVLERGKYKNGQRDSTWVVLSFNESKYPNAYEEIKTEIIDYKKGKIKEHIAIIEDKGLNSESFDLEKGGNLYYITLRKQILKNGKLTFIEKFDTRGKKAD